MTTALLFPLLFGLVAASVATVLVVALRRGRVPPARRWAWVVGLVLAALGMAYNLTIVVAMLISVALADEGPDQPMWSLLFGSIALACVTVLAFVNPRWAAWVFGVTAVVVPALVALTSAVVDPQAMAQEFPALAIVGFYSVRALITALFLWLGSLPVRGSRPPASPSPAPRSENVPIG
jgi:hypothetical protein